MVRDLLIIDLETSGLDPDRHSILEVGAVVLHGMTLREIRSYSAAIYYDSEEVDAIRADAGEGALAVSGWDGPPAGAVALRLALRHLSALPPGMVIFFNQNVEFDRGFLLRAWRELCTGAPPEWMASSYHTLDLRHLAWPPMLTGVVTSRSLSSLCEWAHVERPEPHRALDDARATAAVLRWLLGWYNVRREEALRDGLRADDVGGRR